MPELPEVESIRRSITPRLAGVTITSAVLHRRDVLVLPTDPAGGFGRQPPTRRKQPTDLLPFHLLQGLAVTEIRRHGKQLAILAHGSAADAHSPALLVQLGMSGQLFHRFPGQPIPNPTHIHAEWTLAHGVIDRGRLIFRDPRRFGGLRWFESANALRQHWAALGPDALTLTSEHLAQAATGARRAIKALLLDQAAIAGVGNIYADEALFRAGIRPGRQASRMTHQETERLAQAIREVLAEAVEAGGSTLRDYVDADGNPGSYQASHAVYGRGGQRCEACGHTLRSGTLAQRTTVWCTKCQK